MNCNALRDLLPLYAGGEVEENERIAVDGHLPYCPDCARELNDYREARGLLSALREEGNPPDLWKNIRPALFPTSRSRVLAWSGPLRYAAALLIGLSVGFLSVTLTRRPTSEDRPVAVGGGEFRGFSDHSTGGAGLAGGAPDRASRGAPRIRLLFPRSIPDDRGHYLPRAETVLVSGERDF